MTSTPDPDTLSEAELDALIPQHYTPRGGMPRQHRGKVTYVKILTAAREVIAEQGRDRFTTGDVTVRAGVSIGTFYRYFLDRADLLEVLLTSSPRLEQGEQDVLTAAVRWARSTTPKSAQCNALLVDLHRASLAMQDVRDTTAA